MLTFHELLAALLPRAAAHRRAESRRHHGAAIRYWGAEMEVNDLRAHARERRALPPGDAGDGCLSA